MQRAAVSRAVAAGADMLLKETQAAERLGVSRRTLQRWRISGDGPPFVRIGPRRVAYAEAALAAWCERRTFHHRAAEVARRSSAEADAERA